MECSSHGHHGHQLKIMSTFCISLCMTSEVSIFIRDYDFLERRTTGNLPLNLKRLGIFIVLVLPTMIG